MNFKNLVDYGKEILDLDLFENISLPSGIDKELVVNQILMDCWDFTPMYNEFLLTKEMTEHFFKAHYNEFEEIYKAMIEEYDPLYNYDRYEEYKKNTTDNEDYSETRKDNRDIVDSETTVNQVSAYNGSDYQNDNKSTIDGDTTDSLTSNSSHTKGNTGNETQTNHLYGNIGVTTSQQMLESEINLRVKYNIYEIISHMYRSNLLIRLL